MNAAQCRQEVVRTSLNELMSAFNTGQYPDLEEFVFRNSDGLGRPLPPEVCINLALTVACAKNLLPEYSTDLLQFRDARNRERRTQRQRLRRSAERLGEPIASERCRHTSLAPRKNSTVHVVKGALFVRHWTGAWHHREQTKILEIMGLHKGEDFIRDRIDYLRRCNPAMFESIELLAAGLRKRG